MSTSRSELKKPVENVDPVASVYIQHFRGFKSMEDIDLDPPVYAWYSVPEIDKLKAQRDELLAVAKAALPTLWMRYMDLLNETALSPFGDDPAYLKAKADFDAARAAIAKVEGEKL